MKTVTYTQINAYDILERARSIVQNGTLHNPNDAHGANCPWCAIAQAKSELDTEHGYHGDGPLELARIMLGDTSYLMTQDQSLQVIDHALTLDM